MTTIMPTETILPCFIPASQNASDSKAMGGDQDFSISLEDPLDFDLLAEYLLEDGGSSNSGFTMDFSDSPVHNIPPEPTPSSIVSPDLQSTQIPNEAFDGMFSIPLIHQQNGHQNGTIAAPPSHASSVQPLTSFQNIATVSTTQAPQQMDFHQDKKQRLGTNPQQAMNEGDQQAIMSNDSMNNNEDPDSGSEQKPGRKKSQAQIDRRRERNRILARRTRLRKKFFFESLQKEVMELQRENLALKDIVRSRIDPEKANPILTECNTVDNLPEAVIEQCGDPRMLAKQDFNLMASIRQSQQCFVITDPSLQDNPIVYASDDFLTLTGYSREDVLGRNCRFLQGTDTNQNKVAQIRKAISNGEDVSVTFVNYKSDGTPFWNKLFVAALRDAQSNVVNYIGVSVKVAGPEPGDPEAGKVLVGEKVKDTQVDTNVDADAAFMAIEGAVEKAVATAPTMST